MSDVDVTADFTSEIERAIRACRFMVLCVTPGATRPDSFVRREIAFASLERRPIVVARFADVIPPISVVTNTFFEFHTGADDALAQLLRVVHQADDSGDTNRTEGGLADHERAYLGLLYRDVVDILDETVLLPVTNRRGRLLDLTGAVTASLCAAPSNVVSDRFRARKVPILSSGLRTGYDRSRGRLGITGSAGSGKTVSLLALTRDLASTALTEPGAPLPVLVSAATWGANGLIETTLTDWVGREVPALGSHIGELMGAGRVVLLVDGLDEIPTTGARIDDRGGSTRDDLMRLLTSVNRLVVAGRTAAFEAVRRDLGIRAVFELQPLDDAQISAFVRHLPDASAVLHADPALWEISRSPVMLTMLCSVVDLAGAPKAAHLTANEARDLVVDAFVESRLARESSTETVHLDDLQRGLGELAMSDAGGGGNRNLFTVGHVRAALGPAAFALAIRTGLLLPIGPSGSVRFLHVAVRDRFAFRAAVAAADDTDNTTRDSAAWALWQIPDPRALDVLLHMLDDPYSYARGSAAGALGRLGDPRAVPRLRRLLDDATPVYGMYGSTIREVAQAAIDMIEQ